MKRPGRRSRVSFSLLIPWGWLAVWMLLVLLGSGARGLQLAREALAWVCYWATWLLLLYLLGRWWRWSWRTYYRLVRWWRRAQRQA